MNKLAIKLFFIKYYDIIFSFALLSIIGAIYLYGKKITSLFNKWLRNIKPVIFLAAIILLGFSVRLYKIKNPLADWHSFRQADTASVTRLYVENGINLLYPKYYDISTTQSGMFNPQGYRFVEFPVFNFIHTLLYSGIGFFSLEIWGRLLSILASLASTYLIYLIGKRFLDEKGGLISAAVFALLPFNIYFSRVILPEPLAVCFGLFFLWFSIRYYDSEKARYIYVASVFFAISILIKPYTLFYSIPVIYLIIDKFGLKKALFKKELIISSFVIITPFIAWRIWMSKFPEGIPFWKWTLNGDDIRFKPSFWYWIFGERLSKLILGYWGLVPFVFGLFAVNKKRAFIYFFLLGCILYMFVFATANVRHDYYQTIIIPAVSLTVSAGILEILKLKSPLPLFKNSFLGISIIFALFIGFYQTKEFYKINRPEIVTAGQEVDKLIPKDALIIAPYNGDTAFLYQTKRKGWPVVDRPIDEMIQEGAQYFVSVDLSHYQTVEFQKRFKTLEKNDQFIILDLTKEVQL